MRTGAWIWLDTGIWSLFWILKALRMRITANSNRTHP